MTEITRISIIQAAALLAGHQKQGEDHQVLEAMDDPRPGESPRIQHALAPHETGESGHDDARRSRGVAEPVAETKEGRGHPERLRGAQHRHEPAEENGAEPILLLGCIENGERECQGQSLDGTLKHVNVRPDGGHELSHERACKEEREEWPEPRPRTRWETEGHWERCAQIASREEQVATRKVAANKAKREQQARDELEDRVREDELPG